MYLKEFQKKFNVKYSKYIESKISELLPYCEDETLIEIVKYMGTYQEGGKRTRPFLIATIYSAFNGEGVEIDDIGISYELLHAIALVHDDIMDQGTMRHGKLAYHTFVEKLYKGDYHSGISHGILVGDWFLSRSYENLYNSCTDIQVLQYFAKIVQELVMGQMIDTHLSKISFNGNLEQIKNKDRLKSGAYSFMRPMCLGGILAGCGSETLEKIEELGDVLGIVYQIRDDYLDITGTHGHENKTRFSDLSEGNQTLVLTTILETVTKSHRELILSHRGKKISPEDISKISAIIEESGALEATKVKINALLDESQELLNSLIPTTKKEHTALSEIIDYLRV